MVTAIFNFGRFELRLGSRQLLRNGRPVTLGARAFDVLEALVERRDRVVTKGELLDLVWAGLVVEENNLQVQVSTLRKLLGPRAIVTVPGRGYRFAFDLATEGGDPPAMPHAHWHNLPERITSLIGRERETADVEKALAIARLLTVVGVGGIGKTRLALQVATDVLDDFAEGVWFVELATLNDPRLVPKAVAGALGIKERGPSLADTLLGEIGHRALLLVLDNCEHLIESAAQLCQSLLASCPNIRILATSREMLRVPGESTYRVPSLATPDPRSSSSADDVARYPAVQLLVDRALAVKPSFGVNAANATAIASVCSHLDGIPLAIELAAARLRSMSIEEVNERLDHRFHLLTGGLRTAVPRQRTLRATIDWSHELLHEAEQALFRRLAVFTGGWTLQAAEYVCAGNGVDAWQVLDLLESLVDKNLALADERDGATRYGLLETVREYALERLRDRNEETCVQQRHLACFLTLAEEAEPQLYGAEQQTWLDRLDREHDNLRSALARSLQRADDTVSGLRLAGALGNFWWMRGYLAEGRRWLCGLLDAASDAQPARVRVKALRAAAGIALGQADYAAARALHEEGLAISRVLGDREGIASSLIGMGYCICTEYQADSNAATAIFEESLVICRELGDRRGVAMTLNGLGVVALLTERDYAAARARYEEALAIFVALGDRHGAGYALTGLGNVALNQDDYAAAKSRYEEALTLARELGDRRGIAESLDGLAVVASAFVGAGRAACIWGAAKRLREEFDCLMIEAMRPEYDRRVAAARASLRDDAAFDRAWQEGRAMALEHAMEYALGHI